MPSLLASSRRDVEKQSFPLLVVVLVPLLSLGLQSFLPRLLPQAPLLDLPLLITLYFALARRSPIEGSLIGTVLGLLQDGLTGKAIGINGVAKTLLGFLAASTGSRIDVENHGARLLLNFFFTLLTNGIVYLVQGMMLGGNVHWNWLYELLRAVINAGVGVILFALLDLTRRKE